MDAKDWRAQFQPDIRQRTVNEIMSKLVKHHRVGDDDELLEVRKIAQSFEHKTYAGATSQVDYLQKIFSMMSSFEDPNDWRAQLQPDSRRRIVNKIVGTLTRHLPFSGQEGFNELRRIAERFEEKIYNDSISQSDYLRKISLKMLTMENRSQNNTVQQNGAHDLEATQGNQATNQGESSGRSTRARRLPIWTQDYHMEN